MTVSTPPPFPLQEQTLLISQRVALQVRLAEVWDTTRHDWNSVIFSCCQDATGWGRDGEGGYGGGQECEGVISPLRCWCYCCCCFFVILVMQ